MTADFTQTLMAAATPDAAFAALHAHSQGIVPVRLWTVMQTDAAAGVARRAFTSDPVEYPTSGTKPIPQNAWSAVVHDRRETFVANDIATIAGVFPDHETIARLGCASCVNLPVFIGDALAGTVNLLDEENAFPPDRVALLQDKLLLPAVAAFAVARDLGR